MRIYATINERTVRRTFREQNFGRTGLAVIDKDLPPFALKVTRKGAKTFIVRVVHKLGRDIIVLGNVHEITAEQAREKAVAAIAAAKTERETGPLFADFVKEFMRRWFDSMSGTPGNANRTLPVLSVMMRQAEHWDIRPQGSNPCRSMRRYKMTPRERFLVNEAMTGTGKEGGR